ncbi:MAG: hypothetical protein JW891_04315 [Candidatus Lokiarchaeota archaeon]|nr:hypothetical protein [Candidatus Lokiarchaeota archaeon]
MYDDFIFDPEPHEVPVYIYNCAICDVEVRTKTIFQCDVCKKMVCKTHYYDGFCIKHYQELSDENKALLRKLSEEHKQKEETALIFCCCSVSIPIIVWLFMMVGFFMSLNASIDSKDYTIASFVPYIITVALSLICIFGGLFGYAYSSKNNDKKFDNERMELYKANAKNHSSKNDEKVINVNKNEQDKSVGDRYRYE